MKTRAESKSYGGAHYQRAAAPSSNNQRTAETGEVLTLHPGDGLYPACLGPGGPALHARGDAGLLERRRIAIFSSKKATGAAILRGLDWARTVTVGDQVVISGFHAPPEQECLTLMLKRAIPVIACPAREVTRYRLPGDWQTAAANGLLLVLSPFSRQPRITARSCSDRNELVARLADEIVVLHAGPSSATESLTRRCKEQGKTVRFLDEENRPLAER